MHWCAVISKNKQKSITKSLAIVKSRGVKYVHFWKGKKHWLICMKIKRMKNKKNKFATNMFTQLVRETKTDFLLNMKSLWTVHGMGSIQYPRHSQKKVLQQSIAQTLKAIKTELSLSFGVIYAFKIGWLKLTNESYTCICPNPATVVS